MQEPHTLESTPGTPPVGTKKRGILATCFSILSLLAWSFSILAGGISDPSQPEGQLAGGIFWFLSIPLGIPNVWISFKRIRDRNDPLWRGPRKPIARTTIQVFIFWLKRLMCLAVLAFILGSEKGTGSQLAGATAALCIASAIPLSVLCGFALLRRRRPK